MIGNIVLLALLGLCAALAVGKIWKDRKNPHCGGDCAHCVSSCHTPK